METRLWSFYMKDGTNLFEIVLPFKIKDICEARKQILYMRTWPYFKGKFIFSKSYMGHIYEDEEEPEPDTVNIRIQKVLVKKEEK